MDDRINKLVYKLYGLTDDTWELGYADKSKTNDNILIIPIIIDEEYDETKWEKREYMGLYSRLIMNGNINDSFDNNSQIYHADGTTSSLGVWLSINSIRNYIKNYKIN